MGGGAIILYAVRRRGVRAAGRAEGRMTPEEFVAELDAANQEALGRLGAASTAGEPSAELSVPLLLKLALKNEIEAAEIAARWMADSPELVNTSPYQEGWLTEMEVEGEIDTTELLDATAYRDLTE